MKYTLSLFFYGLVVSVFAQTVRIEFNKTSARQKYAASRLENALNAKGLKASREGEWSIILSMDKILGKEAFSITSSGNKIAITGGDESGILYGCFSLADDIRNGVLLDKILPRKESPKLPFRGIKYDLPWDTYRHSTSLSQHQQTCQDIKYWESFLDMLAENRFNVLTLWNLHPYTLMIKPKNFPEASPWTDEEMKSWKDLFGGIFKMASERCIETYVIPFNIFVTPEFSKAHNVAMDNLDHHFFVKGDTSEIVRRYTRECVTQLLNEYPDLAGMGLTLGEGMGGMTPQQREDWMKETIIAGMSQANRKSKLIHRIPFSSTTGSLGPTSIETEKLTRKGIEKEAAMNFIEGPIWADLKFNWSHPISTTQLIKVHGGKLYGSYFSPVPKTYKIIWTARNEDFFCLRWGDPDFIRSHIQTNSLAYVGGYLVGSETYIPAKDYFTKPGVKVNWKYAFERQWLFYKIWGRLLYEPETDNRVFQQEFIRRYGLEAGPLLQASILAGKTPQRLASQYDFTWDFTLYAEGFMALNPTNKRVEYISIDRFINQPALDPDYLSVADYVKALNSGMYIGPERMTPLKVAKQLDKDCNEALHLIKDVSDSNNPSLAQELADIRVWANLGLHLSEKLLGAIALEKYRTTGHNEDKVQAIEHLEDALLFWDEVVTITKPLYNTMPLVHLSEQDGKPWKENDNLRFHWYLLRPEVIKDVEIAKTVVPLNPK